MAFVSAGAYAREIDLSLYAETLTNTIFAMAHTFAKGPIGVPTLVTNTGNLQSLFGDPIDPTVSSTACQGWFAAREYLKRGNKLYITRVESTATPAQYAAQSIQGPTNDYITTAVDGATSIPATRTLTSAGAAFITAGVLAGDVLEIQGGADAGFYKLTLVAATVLTVDRDWPTGSLTGQTYYVWTAKKEAGADGATSTSTNRTFTSALATFVTNGVAAGDILLINDGTTAGDNGTYLITVVAATTLTVDRDFPVGSLTGLDYTVYSANSKGADGNCTTAGEFLSAAAKFQGHKVQAGDILRINDLVSMGNNGDYLITALKTGSENTTLQVNVASWPGGALTGLDYEVLPGSILFQGLTKGTWCTGLKITPSRNSGDSQNFDLLTASSTGSIQYEKVYNMDRANVAAEMTSNSQIFSATVKTNRLEPVPGKAFYISGGNDGYTGIVDGDYIGSTSALTGLHSFDNGEKIDINLIACPGITSQNVGDALIAIAEKRADCYALVDPPDWTTINSVQEVLDWHNGLSIRTVALNTSYAGLYWTWQEVYDEIHDVDVWTAPSGHAAAVFAYNDNQQAPWFAPAGMKRGKVIGSKDVRYSPTQDDRDSLYGPGANVNPIVNFVGEGVYIWGQKTLQRATTALNRVSVRRMLLYCEKVIATAAKQLVFDPNDDVLDREFKQLVEPVLTDVLTKRGIREFKILAATTDNDRSNNKAVYKLYIKPQSTAEIIEIQFILTPQGANFQELTA